MKKIMATIAIVILVVFSAFSVSAASVEISPTEQQILDALSAGITTSNGTVTIPAADINQVKQYLLKKDISAADATQIIAKIDSAKAVAATAEGTSFSEVYNNMPAETKTEVIGIAQSAASIAGATLSVNATSKTVTITDPTAGTFTLDVNAIKKTGVSGNVVMAGVASVILLGAVCYTILASRKIALSK